MMNRPNTFKRIFTKLYDSYGPQGWWPVLSATNSHQTSVDGYHPGSYEYPRSDLQRLEISIGAILTQQTTWKNANNALISLFNAKLVNISRLQNIKIAQLALVIKSAGYYNQKARYLKNFADFLTQYPFEKLYQLSDIDLRSCLLKVKGVGPETADCIMLYALNRPSFVVDAYTKRILSRLELIGPSDGYDIVKKRIESEIESDIPMYQEFHALLVHHGKNYYSKRPYGINDHILSNRLFN